MRFLSRYSVVQKVGQVLKYTLPYQFLGEKRHFKENFDLFTEKLCFLGIFGPLETLKLVYPSQIKKIALLLIFSP